MIQWKIKEEKTTRIDKFLQEKTNQSRNQIQQLIKSSQVLVNHKETKPSYILRVGDLVSLSLPEEKKEEAPKKVNLNLEIIYEDEYLAIINKPKGLVVHPSDSYEGTTLVNGLLYEFDKLSNQSEPFRQGIVHRLDKDTSGLLIVGKDDLAHEKLKLMFQRCQIRKHYLAIVYHEFKEYCGNIEKPIIRHPKHRQMMTTAETGRNAITKYEVLSQNNGFAYLKLNLVTGRTHQIRVHLKSINHPILGDPIYGPKKVYGKSGPFLHAYQLEFNHPITKEKLNFIVEPPQDFKLELVKRHLVV
ncbi:MAG: RluA family pseudouridine synthase [Acholeplasmataceae bacterium]|jgi:23S rRNA pseudouridine1911/1915/1917 synthase